MRQVIFLIGFIVTGISCSDFYVKHDYPIYNPAVTKEQAQWIRFGFSDSLAFIDTAGNKKVVSIIRRDTTPPLDWEGSPSYKTLELHGINYNYSSLEYYTEFRIDSIFCWLRVSIDSAKLFQGVDLVIQLRVGEESIDLSGTSTYVINSSIIITNKSYNTFMYENPSPAGELIQTICISPEFGILWIKFTNGDEWRNTVMLQ